MTKPSLTNAPVVQWIELRTSHRLWRGPVRRRDKPLMLVRFQPMNVHYVYVLKLDDKKLYTGSTSDLRRRRSEHERDNVASTKFRLPARLLLYEAYHLRSDTERRERFLKTTEGKRLLKQQIRDVLRYERVI